MPRHRPKMPRQHSQGTHLPPCLPCLHKMEWAFHPHPLLRHLFPDSPYLLRYPLRLALLRHLVSLFLTRAQSLRFQGNQFIEPRFQDSHITRLQLLERFQVNPEHSTHSPVSLASRLCRMLVARPPVNPALVHTLGKSPLMITSGLS